MVDRLETPRVVDFFFLFDYKTILARQSLTSGIERDPVVSLWYDRRQETFVNLWHIGLRKGKTVNL